MVAAKVFYYYPIKHFINALFRRKDLIPHLLWDSGAPPEGDVRRSSGFKQKVADNPKMNEDPRNIAIIGTTDGVPFFDDQVRGCWPFFLRVANLPDGLSTHMANVHMSMIVANEHLTSDPLASKLRREVKAPKSLQPQLTVLCDDLLDAYENGVETTDYSCIKEDPSHFPLPRRTAVLERGLPCTSENF